MKFFSLLLYIALIIIFATSFFCESENSSQIVEVIEPSNDGIKFTAVNEWYRKADMNISRKYMSGAAYGNKIYIFGGKGDNETVLNSVEIYDPILDKWEISEPMPIKIHSNTAIAFKDKIYLFGGSSDTMNSPINTVLTYDPINHIWEYKSSLPYKRSGLGSVLFGEKIYVLGGLGENPEKVMEYSIKDNKWKVKNASMPTPRYYMSCVLINDFIYTFNGIHKVEPNLIDEEIYKKEETLSAMNFLFRTMIFGLQVKVQQPRDTALLVLY